MNTKNIIGAKLSLALALTTLINISSHAAEATGNVVSIQTNIANTAAAVTMDITSGNGNPASCANGESLIVFDAGNSAGKNALATLLAAKANASQVKLNIHDSTCFASRYPNLISVTVL